MTVRMSFVALTFAQQFPHLTKHGVLGSVRRQFRNISRIGQMAQEAKLWPHKPDDLGLSPLNPREILVQ